MSATGRSDVREENDVYITPSWSVRRFLEAYDLPAGATVLDPCAANGELLTEIHRLRPDLVLFAIEIRPEAEPALATLKAAGVIEDYAIQDFILLVGEHALDARFDFVITNPPYAWAEAFIRMSMKIAKVSAFFLRLNFLGSKGRNAFLAETRPALFVSSDRPSFDGVGTDATEYAWQLFGDERFAGTWQMLPLTDKAELSAAKIVARNRAASSVSIPAVSSP